MNHLLSSGQLALAKLRGHKVSTVISVIIVGLLFGLVATVSFAADGLTNSADRALEGKLASRYFVRAMSKSRFINPGITYFNRPDVKERLKQEHLQLIAKKTERAKQLGVAYDSSTDQPPYTKLANGDEELNYSSSIVQNENAKFHSSIQLNLNEVSNLAKPYHSVQVFKPQSYRIGTLSDSGHNLKLMINGHEKFYDTTNESSTSHVEQKQYLQLLWLVSAPDNVLSQYMLPHNGNWKPSDGSIPLVLPIGQIEKVLGLQTLDKNATVKQKLARLNDVKKRAQNLEFTVCYRNGASQNLFDKYYQQQKDMRIGKGTANYVEPTVLYALPDDTKCANPYIIKDTRTAQQRQIEQNQAQFDREFNDNYADPVSYPVKIKVVGLTSGGYDSTNTGDSMNLLDIVDDMFTISMSNNIPDSLMDQIPNATKAAYPDMFRATNWYDNNAAFIEFKSLDDAQRFINEQGCDLNSDQTACKNGDQHKYVMTLSISNAGAINQLREIINNVLAISYLILGIISIIIMWLVIGRTIADSRHETAVFRAIGLKQRNVYQIYISYALILSTFMIIVAIIIGIIGAGIIDYLYSPAVTTQLQYNLMDTSPDSAIRFIGFDAKNILLLIAAIYLSGLISAILATLLRRHRPVINDLRNQ